MGHIKRRRHTPANLVGIPQELYTAASRITLIGFEQLTAENHKGLARMSTTAVDIRLQDGVLAITGQGLRVAHLSKTLVVVEGQILGLSAGRPGDPPAKEGL